VKLEFVRGWLLNASFGGKQSQVDLEIRSPQRAVGEARLTIQVCRYVEKVLRAWVLEALDPGSSVE